MANHLRGEIPLVLGDRKFILRPSFSAIVDIEGRLGGVVALAMRASKGNYGLKDVATVIWCTLRQPEPDRPSLDEIGEMVMAKGLAQTAEAMKQVLTMVLGGNQAGTGAAPDQHEQ